jgi:hypothetical protein
VRCLHLHGDGDGETHLTAIAMPVRDTEAGTVRGISGIPVSTLGMGEFVGRKPDVGVHHAPKRQFLVVLQGELEITTTLGWRECLGPGDVLFADDVGTKGHISRDVGDDPLMIMAVAIDGDWELPRD